jgi:hypothetical protein
MQSAVFSSVSGQTAYPSTLVGLFRGFFLPLRPLTIRLYCRSMEVVCVIVVVVVDDDSTEKDAATTRTSRLLNDDVATALGWLLLFSQKTTNIQSLSFFGKRNETGGRDDDSNRAKKGKEQRP